MAPVVLALRREPWVDVRIVATAQHRQMLDQVLVAFGLAPDIDLDIMRPDQSLPDLTARLLLRLDRVFADEAPDAVLAPGDPPTALAVRSEEPRVGQELGTKFYLSGSPYQ